MSSQPLLSAITGIDNKKGKLNLIKTWISLINSAAVMVIPERDVPGIKAKDLKNIRLIKISELRIISRAATKKTI